MDHHTVEQDSGFLPVNAHTDVNILKLNWQLYISFIFYEIVK